MPENPEVLTTVDMMNFYMINKTISNINFISGKHYEDSPDDYELLLEDLPLMVDKVYCKGKQIVIQLSKDSIILDDSKESDAPKKWWILNHLVMTGSWQLQCKEEQESYVRCRIEFDKREQNGEFDIESIDFIDIRDLGKFDFINDVEVLNSRLSSIANGFIGDFIIDFKTFKTNISKCKKASLITKLRDQKSICSGIGNYLISEIMYEAQLSYLLKCNELSNSQIRKLYNSCKLIITQSYIHGGLSVENYVNIYGEKGTYEQFLKVYRKDGKNGRTSCDPYGNKVVSIKKGQTFWYVPGLQRKDLNDPDVSIEFESESDND